MKALFFASTVFFLTRQVPFNSLPYVFNISLLCFLILSLPGIIREHARYFLFCLLFVSFLLVYSLMKGEETGLAIRSYAILLFILSAYFIEPNDKYIKYFLFFTALQAAFVIFLQLWLLLTQDVESYLPIRKIFLNNNWGDIYTYSDRFLWKVQLLGNALLPLSLFISIFYTKHFIRFLLIFVFLLACVFAGNFAFILAIFLFFPLLPLLREKVGYRYVSSYLVFLFICSLILLYPLSVYLAEVISRKAISSNPIRVDQIVVLWNDLSSTVMDLLMGKGLGNTVEVVTEWRDYSGRIYYELQLLYFANQLGLIGFLVFCILNVFLVIKFIKSLRVRVVYLLYLFYASFNPYLLDTNHFVAIVVLVSLDNFLIKRKSEVTNTEKSPALSL